VCSKVSYVESRAAYERYRAFFETSVEGIWRFELDEPVRVDTPVDDQINAFLSHAWLAECNAAMARMYGHEHAGAIVGARLPDLMPADDPHNREYLRRFIVSGYRLADAESHEVDRHGHSRIFVNSLVGIVEDGRLTGAWGTQVDITAQREQEILLRESDGRLRMALAAAGMGTWRVDVKTRQETRDASLNRILGLPDRETTQLLDDFIARIHPDDQARVRAAMERAVRERGEYSEEVRIVRPDGVVRWIRDRGRVVTDEHGSPHLITGAVMDVTDQRRAEEHDRLLGEATQALTASVDPHRAVADVADALVPRFAQRCTVHFLESDDLTEIASAGHGDAVEERLIAEVTRSGSSIVDERAIVVPLRAAGRIFGAIALSTAGAWRRYDAGDGIFAAELADRVALAVDHARLFRDLERANHVKDEFLATLSHELRTPLNAVLGWTRMLLRGSIPPERTPSILETIERNAAAQVQLIEELLDLSAMVAGGLRLNVTRVDIREIVGGAIETVRPAADAKGLSLRLNVRSHIDEIAADPARLRQALWNLLSNAVKFTPPGGTIDVGIMAGPTDVEIVIRDTGRGIAQEFIPYVFEQFRQADSSSTRQVGGLGLGLAIVRHIVEAHGGTVTAQSDGIDRGSTFAVRLPTGHAAAGTSQEMAEHVSLRGRRVLAVDDDESTQELVATMLLMYGVSVRTAGRAAQAIQILSDWRPDVLLTDIAMPGEDGYALMRRVRAMPPPLGTIPAVALTAYTDPQSVQNAFGAGFDAHLGKPLEPHVLADALMKVLRVRRPRA
jgi:PAS domain S-box-containing protein